MPDALERKLADGPTDAMPPKARWLAVLAAAGLPVPPAVVVSRAGAEAVAARMLAGIDALAIRSCGADEDDHASSHAGLHHSVLGVRAPDAVAPALARIDTDVVLVQQQIAGEAVAVAAVTEHGVELELYPLGSAASDEVLSGHRDPVFAGRLGRWEDPRREAVTTAVQGARRALAAAVGDGGAPHGWDLELVLAGEAVWLVQARPLVAALHPDWDAFAAAVADEQGGEAPDFGPRPLVLDAEHNPAPLSDAHGWVMHRLAAERDRASGHPTVLAGWLYVATLPRALAAGRPPPPPGLAVQTLHDLRAELLPAARDRLGRLRETTRSSSEMPSPDAVAATLEEAWAAFLAMIDAYVGRLVPARQGVRAGGETTDPLSLRERARYLDVLPATWDIASATLAELGVRLPEPEAEPRLPDDDATARTLLAEWDDHLFALGLAPLREVFRWVGASTDLGDDVFLLGGDELPDACRGTLPDLDARRRRAERRRRLAPPMRIEDGHPVTAGLRPTRVGIGIGPPASGIATHRHDLAALLAAPPADDAIVIMPALTAPAAVALHATHVRAVCCEHGGALSHAALMARELDLSALIGCRGCLTIPEGTPIHLDTQTGHLHPRR